MSEPRAWTPDELRDSLLEHVRQIAHYWATNAQSGNLADRCDGVAFSILAMMDGCTIGIPPVDLVFRPHEEDKQYHIDNGENWIEDGTTISDALHEHYYKDGPNVRR